MTATIKTIFLTCIFGCLQLAGYSQSDIPVLHTQTEQISIIDGDVYLKDYWYIDPSLKPDVYEANKYNQTKWVSFCSDIDTLKFELAPYASHDFIILHNVTDTCWTRLQSGIHRPSEDIVLVSDTLPFVLTNDNNILVETVINQIDTLQLMFHTAMHNIGVTEAAAKEMKSINMDGSVEGNSWGGTGQSRYSQGNTFQVGRFTFENQTIWEGKNSGPQSDGKFGPHLFDEQVLEINFSNSEMVVHSTLPELDAAYHKTDLIFQQSDMYLEVELLVAGEMLKQKALIHSGYASNLLLDGKFSEAHALSEKLELESSTELKDSYGNSVFTQSAKMDEVKVLAHTFEDLLVNFFAGTIGNQTKSVLGSNVLKRFDLIFDFQTATLYYKPSSLMGTT